MATNLEARLERAMTQIEAMDCRLDTMQLQARADLDEIKLIIDKSGKSTHDLIEKHQDKDDTKHKELGDHVQALQFWRWMLFGAFSVLAVFGSMTWYFTSNLMMDEIRTIRQGLHIPAPTAAK